MFSSQLILRLTLKEHWKSLFPKPLLCSLKTKSFLLFLLFFFSCSYSHRNSEEKQKKVIQASPARIDVRVLMNRAPVGGERFQNFTKQSIYSVLHLSYDFFFCQIFRQRKLSLRRVVKKLKDDIQTSKKRNKFP